MCKHIKLYKLAAKYAKSLTIAWHEKPEYIFGGALWPNGPIEWIGKVIKPGDDFAKIKLGIALQHGWHIACLHKKITVELLPEENKLLEAAAKINLIY